jgi:hypothetical protein
MVFGVPGGGNFVVEGGGTTGAAAGAGAGADRSDAAFKVFAISGCAVPARHTISFSNVMNLSCVNRTR